MGGLLALVILGVMALLLVVAAELARTLVFRLARLPRERPVLKMLDVRGRGDRKHVRLVAVAIGPVGGYLSIAMLAFVLYRCNGIRDFNHMRIDRVTPGYPADGLVEPGDMIVEVNGQPFVGGAAELHELAVTADGRPLAMTIQRGSARVVLQLAPKQTERGPLFGFVLQPSYVTPSIPTSAALALEYPALQMKVIVRGVRDIFVGREEADPGGPVRIVSEFQQAFEDSTANLLRLAMMLGVYLLFGLIGFDLVRAILVIVRKPIPEPITPARLIE